MATSLWRGLGLTSSASYVELGLAAVIFGGSWLFARWLSRHDERIRAEVREIYTKR